jgi:hypothetical protein
MTLISPSFKITKEISVALLIPTMFGNIVQLISSCIILLNYTANFVLLLYCYIKQFFNMMRCFVVIRYQFAECIH